ncbi:hypothetical protein LOTGIDRAFT_235142 [Lottia gigantea]|uniref:Protein pitchfork n=1 Tax=Lottia gigantea TaxID=225164 RepID=V4A0Z2_LOTGI|nr:hypothetical protein LOTGIDRAFT_235142 [Lottia gigantea]ESO86946.1 hypothetical protein LOTGIDRAFT_235142 [Lottia gigantea]
MEVQKPQSNVSFMTTLDRELFPTKMPPNRFGNETIPLRGAPHRGPGCYDNEEKTNFWYDIEHKITSEKGYTLGARTAARIPEVVISKTPCPTTYQTHCTDPKTFTTSKKPFEVGAERVISQRTEAGPGPGAYEHSTPKNRQVQWHQSFGGAPIKTPEISVQSTINKNTDKLFSTKEEKKYHRKLAYLKLYYD